MAVVLIAASTILSGCATLVGGSNYYAHVFVENRPSTNIIYKGEVIGKGQARVRVRRVEADKLSFLLKEDNGVDQEVTFKQKEFRTWAFIGSLVTWTGIYSGVPLPWGAAVDFATGSLWRPDESEMGVTKIDRKNYRYTLTYTGFKPEDGAPANNATQTKTKAEKLQEIKDLLDKAILTKEEFDAEKKKILAE